MYTIEEMLKHIFLCVGNFEREYDDVTIKMIFGIVQVIGFANSICNPIVYAFMNENFKKNFLSAICFCIMKENLSPFRQHKNLKVTTMQHEEGACRRELVSLEETRRGAFSEGNIEVKFCDRSFPKKTSRRHLALFSSEFTGHTSLES